MEALDIVYLLNIDSILTQYYKSPAFEYVELGIYVLMLSSYLTIALYILLKFKGHSLDASA